MIACAAPPGGGRNNVTPRFLRHFNILCLPPTSKESIRKIFSAIVDGFLEIFLPPVKGLSKALVESTIEVYTQISEELLPIPAKCHYTFNLRDVGKVFQGLLMVTPRLCSTAESMTRLWIHEAMRVFHDRLINIDDKKWFTQLVITLCNRNFRFPWKHEDLFENGDPILWCHFLRPGGDDRLYEESKNLNQIVNLLRSYLDDYNATSSNKMNLVFFQDAVEHISRVSRILRQPRGNMVSLHFSQCQSLYVYI
jgi:dynein heavy chain